MSDLPNYIAAAKEVSHNAVLVGLSGRVVPNEQYIPGSTRYPQYVPIESAWPGSEIHPRDPETDGIDMTLVWRQSGMPLWARHCPKCGRWASYIAGDEKAGQWWYRTDCKQCGQHVKVSWWA